MFYFLNRRLLEHEPLPLATALLTALKLQQHASLVVGWRAWNPPPRAGRAQHADLADPATPAAPVRSSSPSPARQLATTYSVRLLV